MFDVLHTPTAVRTDQTSPGPAVSDQTSAAQQAAVAAAEAIAAEAAAGIAAEAAAVAADVVAAASLAAAKATARADRTAAEAAAEVAVVAQAAAETASAAAVVASAAVGHTQARAVADIAEAARVADGVVHAATAAAARAASRARLAATETADELALEAATVAADVVTAAAAAAAKVIEAGDAAAKLVLATAAALTPPVPRNQEIGPAAAGQARLDEPVHTEWASVLADPVMPRAWAASAPLETVVSAASPAEQGLWRDISLARRMQATLRASEARFEAAFSSAPTAMLIATLDDGAPVRFTQVNQALSDLTGWAKSELLGFGFADLTHAEHRTLESDLARPACAAEAQPVERVRRWVHADGHAMWVRIRMAELATSTGRKAELVCQVEDVTAQLAADASFSSGEAQFRLAFVGAPQPAMLIQLTGCPGRVLAVNQAACKLFGRNELEMSWLDLESLTDPVDRPALVDLLDRMANGDVARHEAAYRYQTAAGNAGQVEISAHCVDGPNGLPAYLLAHLRDDTEPTPPQAIVFDTAWARALDL